MGFLDGRNRVFFWSRTPTSSFHCLLSRCSLFPCCCRYQFDDFHNIALLLSGFGLSSPAHKSLSVQNAYSYPSLRDDGCRTVKKKFLGLYRLQELFIARSHCLCYTFGLLSFFIHTHLLSIKIYYFCTCETSCRQSRCKSKVNY